MTTEKDVGLEGVEISDFTEEEQKDEKPKTEKKTETQKLESVFSLPWESVSHVLIGPSGVSLVPAGSEQKYSKFTTDNTTYHPTPGLKPTVYEYDLNQIFGSVNAASELEKELANTRAELEKVKMELAEMKKCATKPKDEDEKKEMAAPPGPQPLPIDVPKGSDAPGEDDNVMAYFKLTAEQWNKMSAEEKNKLREQYKLATTKMEKSKEEIAKEEKTEASVKEEKAEDKPSEKKEADHEENGLATAMKLMQEAKNRKLL